MSENKLTATVTAKMSGWFKALIASCAGLLSGAFMMYLSPLVDRVIKPTKPVANFAAEIVGMTATFHDRSSGGGEGWWDFGDGSPLEPVAANPQTMTHTYPRPGNYVVKLSLRNLIGDESERAVTLQLDKPHTEPPAILALDAVPLSLGAYAPATFQVVSKAKNAQLCVWDLDDDRPLEISTESPNEQDRLVTFKKPGGYMVKLAAVNGDKAAEKSTIVYVDEPPPGTITAILSVTDQATRVEKDESTIPVTAAMPPDCKENAYRFRREVPGRHGHAILAARLENSGDRNARGLDIQVAPDKHSAVITGEILKDTAKRSGAANVVLRAVLTQECRTPATRPAIPVASTMPVPGTVMIPMPPLPRNWVEPQRQLRLELRDGDRVVWQESQLPRGAAVTIQNKPCTLTAIPVGEQVRVQIVEVKNGLRSVSK